MAQIDQLRFERKRPKKLTAGQLAAIRRVTAESLRIDFPDRTEAELQYLAGQSERGRKNPNRSVGGPLFLGDQAFARPVIVLAINRASEEVEAVLPMADSASSDPNASYFSGALERQLKLRVGTNRLMPRRYRWAGLFSLSIVGRAMLIDTPPDEASIIDTALLIGAEPADPRQRLSAFPYEGEDLWCEGLENTGYYHLRDSVDKPIARPRRAFGPESSPVIELTYRHDSVEALCQTILAKEGAERALAMATH